MDKMDGERGAVSVPPGSDEFEERLLQLFRYAQIGRCVNGVTHEINNFLGAVMAYGELVALDENISDESRRMLGQIIEGVRRSAHMLSVFTGIARRDKSSEGLVDVGNLIEHVVTLHVYSIKQQRVSVERSLAPDLPSIRGDATKLELVLHYLFLNALQNVADVERAVVHIAACQEGERVRLTVRDSGPTASEAIRESIFEPFVTTMDGPHLGLGLPTARKLLARNKGSLTYDPAEGFVVTVPVCPPAETPPEPPG
ncbi:MAG: sensor histidine kinase [Candidatus Hydrogenedentota bacterium]